MVHRRPWNPVLLVTFFVVLLAVLAGLAGVAPASQAAPAAAVAPNAAVAPVAAAPVRSLTVSGSGVGSYPDFDPSVLRYAATTTADTDGTLTVTAATSDPDGTVLVDGVPASGPVSIDGLGEGDEVSVVVDDAAGRTAYSVVYLPAGFPALETVVPAEPGLEDGLVLLTLSKWLTPSDSFEVAVDRHGVPAYVHTETDGASLDLKPLPASYGGGYSVFRSPALPGREGSRLVRLDDRFRVVREVSTVGLTNTDPHEAVWNPDGSVYLAAYEPNTATGLTDSVIQQVAADGTLLWQWSTADHVDAAAETVVPGNPDYAHLNSIQVLDDGDLLVSFRHLSAVFEIARTAHDGYAEGEVVWRLGGRRSDWTFPDDPAGTGPCAQHTAYQLPNGHLLMFDNGSAMLTGALCVDQADPTGPVVQRNLTRMLELSLDPATMQASVVSAPSVDSRFSVFAGSAQRLDDGHTLVGWASERHALVSELDASGTVVWELRDPSTDSAYFTYRARLADVPDATPPTVSMPRRLGRVALGAPLTLDARCSDRGGSGLVGCEGPAAPGTALDTTEPGKHTVSVTATDAAGLSSTATTTYRVQDVATDLDVRGDAPGSHPWRDRATGRLASPGDRARFEVRLRHDAAVTQQVHLGADYGSPGFRVRFRSHGEDVTREVARGRFHTHVSAGGRALLQIVVIRRPRATHGDRLHLQLIAFTPDGPASSARVVVRAR